MTCLWGKMKKHGILVKGNDTIRAALPTSRTFSREALDAMLDRYKSVVIKPTGGSGGKGVLFVTSEGSGVYHVRAGANTRHIRGRDALYRHIRGMTKRRLLIQRKIPLATVGGRPFDVRVMVQRKRSGKSGWQVTGKLVRIAGPGYRITNTARSGGRVTTYTAAMQKADVTGISSAALAKRINRLCLSAVRRLHSHCRTLHTVGLDIGVDKAGNPWIIEANFTPNKALFKRLKNKDPYRRIMSYTK